MYIQGHPEWLAKVIIGYIELYFTKTYFLECFLVDIDGIFWYFLGIICYWYNFGFIKTAHKAGAANCGAGLGFIPGAPCRHCHLLLQWINVKKKTLIADLMAEKKHLNATNATHFFLQIDNGTFWMKRKTPWMHFFCRNVHCWVIFGCFYWLKKTVLRKKMIFFCLFNTTKHFF